MPCEAGLRRRTYHILSGSVLSVWTKVESVLSSTPGGIASRMQIIRLRTEDGKKIVGTCDLFHNCHCFTVLFMFLFYSSLSSYDMYYLALERFLRLIHFLHYL